MTPQEIEACSLLAGPVPGGCDNCGSPLTGRRTRWCTTECRRWFERNHMWSAARTAAVKRDGDRCVLCGCKNGLEVNHITPRRGRGYGTGCHNHLDNLETLCHDCHVRVTKRQRRARWR